MPMRMEPLVNGEYYHVFNRGVARLPTFLTDRDRYHAIDSMRYYRITEPPFKLSHVEKLHASSRTRLFDELDEAAPLVEISAFTLMPNHWHMILRQVEEGGLSTYIRRWTNSYTRYFNTKHDRIGPLFQGPFKVVRIVSDELLLHATRYVHLNQVAAGLLTIEQLTESPWSSYWDYWRGRSSWCTSQIVIDLAGGRERYIEFVRDRADYARELERIKHLTLEH